MAFLGTKKAGEGNLTFKEEAIGHTANNIGERISRCVACLLALAIGTFAFNEKRGECGGEQNWREMHFRRFGRNGAEMHKIGKGEKGRKERENLHELKFGRRGNNWRERVRVQY